MTEPRAVQFAAARVRDVVVLADDLSGAAEVAGTFLGRRCDVTLHLDDLPARASGVTVVDLHTRIRPAPAAADAVRGALTRTPTGALVVKKIDSLLRGHIGTEVAALAQRGSVVVAAALPALGRTVRDGVPYVGDLPLHRSGAWTAELGRPPRSVADLLTAQPVRHVPRGASTAVVRAAADGCIAVCDAETDDDLDVIVAAANGIAGVQLVGTAALAAAVARTMPPKPASCPPDSPSRRVLIGVGTAAPAARHQVDALVTHGVTEVAVDSHALLGGTADTETARAALHRGAVVITINGAVAPAESRSLARAFGRYLAEADDHGGADLILTGGETARAVVDALGITALRPSHQINHGAVVSTAPGGRRIVTRPGSFGDSESLVAIYRHLTTRSKEFS